MTRSFRLQQLATINSGYPFRGKIPEVTGTGILAVQMKDVSPQAGVDWAACVQTEITGKRDPDWLEQDDILVAARGNRNYAVLVSMGGGRVPGPQAVAAPHFFVLRPNRDHVLPEYLAWYLNQKPCQEYYGQNSEGTFTKSIRRSVLDNTVIPVPSLDKQKTIIAISRSLHKEQKLVEQLIQNGEMLMTAIAIDLATSN